ncbi:hypothetical protein SASPL_138107 [Salvia splendens]|uniref:Alpha-ketoglutarate-dependent dioxygenase AlkB-like domain-containing protein n=1 Tax=Salvia splendens TaxID=180675 RepID=A0A8X8WUK9_SALSN|nr:hypothetical protein SASPL_138107 [Salvia splendens]
MRAGDDALGEMASLAILSVCCRVFTCTTSRGVKKVMEKYVVGSVPTVMYIPEYISPAEEDLLLKNIDQAPLSKWKTLKNRRLQNWGGVVHEKGLLAQQLPSWLKTVTNRIYEESKLFPSAINHVLINEYLPDQGIMPHQDGPAYMPVVAILSLGDPVVMDFVPHPNLESTDQTSENDSEDMIHDEPSPTEAKIASKYLPFSVVLMPRSLLIFKEMAYSGYLHGIKDSENKFIDKRVPMISTKFLKVAFFTLGATTTFSPCSASSFTRSYLNTCTSGQLTLNLIPTLHTLNLCS